MATFQLFFSVQGTGGSPTGPDTENSVGDKILEDQVGQFLLGCKCPVPTQFKIPLIKPQRRPLPNSRQTDMHGTLLELEPATSRVAAVTKSATFFQLRWSLLRHRHRGPWTLQPKWDWTKTANMCNPFQQKKRLLVYPST